MKHLTAVCAAVAIAVGGTSLLAQTPKKPIDVPEAQVVHGFSVALVLGEQQGGTTPDNLPAGAKKALTDMRDFLPFKSYRLLDSQWILCCAVKWIQPGVSGRLRGIDEQQYAFFVDVLGVTGSKLSLRFALREDVSKKLTFSKPDEVVYEDMVRQEKAARENERASLELRLEDERKRLGPQHPVVREIEARIEKLKREADEKSRGGGGSGKGAVIDSTFSMDVGETVVIGTSSLKGDKALVALLTAARRPGSQSSTLGEKR